jgi:hypothetical protein
MQNDSTKNIAGTVPAYVRSNGSFMLSYSHSEIAELEDLFGKLNEVTMTDQSKNMDLFFDMVQTYCAAKPDQAINAVKLSAMFAGLMSAIGRADDVIANQGHVFEQILHDPQTNVIEFNQPINVEPENELLVTVEDFLNSDGVEQPAEIIGDLVNSFFTALDPYEKDKNGNPELTYKCHNPAFVQEIVYTTNKLIAFLNKLNPVHSHIQNKNAA